MKILAVCGCGCGSSVILKMNASKALKDLGVTADLDVSDITTAKGAASTADLVLVGREMADAMPAVKAPLLVLDSFVNKQEVKDKLEAFFKERGIL